MAMVDLKSREGTVSGYLAIPKKGNGPGVLVLHAWWGLNDFFKGLCDQLAMAGFVAFAPDLCRGARSREGPPHTGKGPHVLHIPWDDALVLRERPTRRV